MTPQARVEQESRAAAHLRRGDFSAALELYAQLARAFPDDPSIAEKLARIQENLQPLELSHPKARLGAPEAVSLSPEQDGERLYALGDFAGAAAAYRRALDAKPDSELIRERLVELFRLAQAAPVTSPTDVALPDPPEARLRALLDRIASRTRLRRG